MQLLITFLEGMITFISPCVLPMLPVYVLYFTGGGQSPKAGRTLLRALCFVLGFSVLFALLGVFSGTLGALLVRYQQAVNLVTGALVVLFGLHYAGILRIAFLDRTIKPDAKVQPAGYLSCALLGVVFAVGWTPCTGPFLGSALMMAASGGQALSGMILLLGYAMGLGVPFMLCALLIDRLKSAFAFIKRHYAVINRVCGVFLIAVGLMMMSGLYQRMASLLPTTPAIELSLPGESAAAPTAEPTQAPAAADEPTAEPAAAPTTLPAQAKEPEVYGPVFRRIAKDFTAYDDAGNPARLSDYRGKPVVVNFFASWCGPCRHEMPYFEEAYQACGDQVQFLMVNLCGFGNDSKDAAKAMVAEGGYTFPVLFDTQGDAAMQYAIRAMPTTVFVSADGELLDQRVGMMDRTTLLDMTVKMAQDAK